MRDMQNLTIYQLNLTAAKERDTVCQQRNPHPSQKPPTCKRARRKCCENQAQRDAKLGDFCEHVAYQHLLAGNCKNPCRPRHKSVCQTTGENSAAANYY